MDDELSVFIQVGLSSDGAADLASVRRSLSLYRAEVLASIKENFKTLIEGRQLTLREFSMINDLDFDTEDDLYTYLEKAYEYLFEDAANPPTPPWLEE
jgi:hypothetical protein